MKKTSSKIISLILSLTLVCTMLVGFGTIETFAEGAKLVKKEVHLDSQNITGFQKVSSSLAGKVPVVDSALNTSMYFNTEPTLIKEGEDNVIKVGTQTSNFIDIYSHENNTALNGSYSTGIFEFTGQIKADSGITSGDWRVGKGAGSGNYYSIFSPEYKKITADQWYNFKMEINLDDNYAYIGFTDQSDSTKVIEKKSTGYEKDFGIIRMYLTIPADKYLYFKGLNISYCDTQVGTKAEITSVGTVPSNSLNFNLDKAITGLEAADVYVTNAAGTRNQATVLTDNGGGSYTATLTEELAELTNYTLTIDGACYDGFLEVSGTDYVEVRDLTQSFSTSAADAQSYVGQLASAFNWNNVTTDYAANNVTAAITLPTSYEGAAVSWTSEPDVIDDEGKLIIPSSGEQTATLQPTLTYQGKTATPASINITLVKTLVYDGTQKFSFINPDLTRSDSTANMEKTYSEGALLGIQKNTWNSYFQIDFTGYEEILEDPTTKLTFSVRLGAYVNSYLKAYDLSFYAVDDRADAYAEADITAKKAGELGLHTVTAEQLVAKRADATEVSRVTYSQEITAEGKQAILNALKSGTDNSIVTFTIRPETSSQKSWVDTGHEDTFIQIDYASEKVDDQAYLDNVAKSLTWDKLSGEEMTAVTEDLKMTSKFMGASVVWTSTNPNAISTNGTVHPLREESQTTDLKAVLTYNEATPKEVEFKNVTVAKEKLESIRINATLTKQVAGKLPDKVYAYADNWNAFYLSAHAMDSTEGDRGDSMAFMQFNLSEYLDDIKLAKNISLNIANRIEDRKGKTGIITLLNDSSDNWDTNITYNIALSNGMQTDPGLYTAENVDFTTDMITVADNAFTSAVKTAIAQDNAEGIISFRLYAMDSEQCNLQIGPSGETIPAPYIEIQYYASDVEGTVTPEITWDAVSDQDIDNVAADLTLPSTWYGEQVTWSSNDTAISDTGVVTVGTEEKNVTLTATINGKTKEFNVTIPAFKIAVRSARMYETAEETRINYTNGYIYANEAVASCSVLIATYNADGELIGITQKDMALAKGRNHVYSTPHYGNAESTITKIIVVDNMTNLEPLAVAK